MGQKNIVQKVYQAKSAEELMGYYNQWAENYDQDMQQDYAWLAPRYTAEVMCSMVPRQLNILDVGCGTGLVGEELKKNGYHHLTGIDFSEAMLARAGEKNCYKILRQMTLGKQLDFENNFFDCIVAVGVFTLGHAGVEALDELVRILCVGGWLVLGIRTDIYAKNHYAEKLARLHLYLYFASFTFQPMPIGEPEVIYQVLVYKKS